MIFKQHSSMKIINPIQYQQLRTFEERIGGNVKVGGYNMNLICPVEEGQCYQVTLEEGDLNRLFLLGEATFTNLTENRNYRLAGLTSAVEGLHRVKYWLDQNLDLTKVPEWAPVFVTWDIEKSPIITIDGNHRLMAHFKQYHTIEGLPGYLFVHHNIHKWGFVPSEAKTQETRAD